MNNIRLFQLLVVSSTVIYIVWFFLPYWSGYLSGDEYRLAEYTGYGAILPVHHVLYYTVCVGSLAYFRPWPILLSKLGKTPLSRPVAAFSCSGYV